MIDELLYPLAFFSAVSMRPAVSLSLLLPLLAVVSLGLRRPGRERVWTALATAHGLAALGGVLFSLESPLNVASCLIGYLGWPVSLGLCLADGLRSLVLAVRTRAPVLGAPVLGMVPRLALHALGFLLILRSAALCTV